MLVLLLGVHRGFQLSASALTKLTVIVTLSITPPATSETLTRSLPRPRRSASQLSHLSPRPGPLFLPARPRTIRVAAARALSVRSTFRLTLHGGRSLRVTLLRLRHDRFTLERTETRLCPAINLTSALRDGDRRGSGRAALEKSLRTLCSLNLSKNERTEVRMTRRRAQITRLSVGRHETRLLLSATGSCCTLRLAIRRVQVDRTFLSRTRHGLRSAILERHTNMNARFSILQTRIRITGTHRSLARIRDRQRVTRERLSHELGLPTSMGISALPIRVTKN